MSEPQEIFFAVDRDAWRAWLEEHHATRDHVWLTLHKKHVAEPCVTLEEAVEEALCFGWIDGRLRRVDDRRHVLRFSPRKPRSNWASSNKARVARLIAEGRMTPAGMAVIDAAKANGSWDRLDERQLDSTPPDLAAALAAEPPAQERWSTLAPSLRRQYVYAVLQAKRPETRARRVADTVRRAAASKAGVVADDRALELFFAGRPGSLNLFLAVRAVIESFGGVEIEVMKTQISFRARRSFAWVWLPQTWIKKRPGESVTLTFALDHEVVDARIAEAVEARPEHWTHHVLIGAPSDLDAQVRAWLREAYAWGGGSAGLVR